MQETLGEKQTVRKQKEVYEKGNGKGCFNYGKVELESTYRSQILDPFVKKLSRGGNESLLILDLGSGRGEASAHMRTKRARVIEADISSLGLKGHQNAIQATGWRLPLPDNLLNGVHLKDMITHVPHEFRGMLFSELRRITKPGGTILLCSANETKFGNYQYPTSQEHLIRVANESGLNLKDVGKWKPRHISKDWYWNGRGRFVLVLENPQ